MEALLKAVRTSNGIVYVSRTDKRFGVKDCSGNLLVRPSRKKRTTQEKRDIIDVNPFCVYCGFDDYNKLVLDHIKPLAKGGSEYHSNITVACCYCNSRKGDFTIDVFLEKTIRNRDLTNAQTYTYCYNLRQLRKGKKCHSTHTEEKLLMKIRDCRFIHSYFTSIISSLNNQRYFLFT